MSHISVSQSGVSRGPQAKRETIYYRYNPPPLMYYNDIMHGYFNCGFHTLSVIIKYHKTKLEVVSSGGL